MEHCDISPIRSAYALIGKYYKLKDKIDWAHRDMPGTGAPPLGTEASKRLHAFGTIKRVSVAGAFNPLRLLHIREMERVRKLGEYLLVIIYNDYQVFLSGGTPVMRERERMEIVSKLKCVDEVFLSIDKNLTLKKSKKYIAEHRGVSVFY